jgi:hypothetical protein
VESVLRFLNAKKTMKLGRAVDWKIPKEQISKLAYSMLPDPKMPDFARVDLRTSFRRFKQKAPRRPRT